MNHPSVQVSYASNNLSTSVEIKIHPLRGANLNFVKNMM